MSQTNVTPQDPKAKQLEKIAQDVPNNRGLKSPQKPANKQKAVSQIANVRSASSLEQIQSQKSTIVNQLRRINQAIRQVKDEERPKSILRQRQEIAKDKQANKHAKSFIAQQKLKKQELLDKRKQQQMKTSALLKQQVEQSTRARDLQESKLREQKRRAISIRINHTKTKREEWKNIQQESNILINKLIKKEGQIRKKIESPLRTQPNIKIIERRPHIDFAQLQKHQQQYLSRKEELSKKKERSVSISYPVKKYQKNRWAFKLDEQQEKMREQQRLKQLEKRMNVEKRQKYGALISSIFVKKKRMHTQQLPQSKPVTKSNSIYVVPSNKSPKTASPSTLDMQRNQSKTLKMKKLINSHYSSVKREEKDQSPQEIQKDRERKEQQKKIRLQTSQRLKKIDSELLHKNKSELQSKYQSNFHKYLGQMKRKKKENMEWSQILKNDELSHQQKYTQLLRNAANLENKAKLKEQLKESNEEVVDLYLNSIQVKLAILQSI